MRCRVWVGAAALLTGAVCASCSTRDGSASPPLRACTLGASIACVGVGGCAGGQVCNTEGSAFGECMCGGSGGDGGTPHDSGPAVDSRVGGETDSGPVGAPDAGLGPTANLVIPNLGLGIDAGSGGTVNVGLGNTVFAVDDTDTNVYFYASTTTSLGDTTYALYYQPISGGMPATPVAVFAPGYIWGQNIAVANGRVYWTELANAPTNSKLMSVDIAKAGGTVIAPCEFLSGGGGGPNFDFVLKGDDIFFANLSAQLTRYNTKTMMLDTTVYGTTTSIDYVAESGTDIYWLVPGASSMAVWAATQGSAGASTLATFATTTPSGWYLGASGADVVVTPQANNVVTFVLLDTSQGPNAHPVTLGTVSRAGIPPPIWDGDSVFVSSQQNSIVQVSVPTGEQVTLGNVPTTTPSGNQNIAVTWMALSPSYVYILGSVMGTVTQLYRLPR